MGWFARWTCSGSSTGCRPGSRSSSPSSDTTIGTSWPGRRRPSRPVSVWMAERVRAEMPQATLIDVGTAINPWTTCDPIHWERLFGKAFRRWYGIDRLGQERGAAVERLLAGYGGREISGVDGWEATRGRRMAPLRRSTESRLPRFGGHRRLRPDAYHMPLSSECRKAARCRTHRRDLGCERRLRASDPWSPAVGTPSGSGVVPGAIVVR